MFGVTRSASRFIMWEAAAQSSGHTSWFRSGSRLPWSGSRSGSPRRRGVMVAASMMPLALAFLATMGYRYEPVYLHFLDLFRETLGGSPVFLSLVAAAVFDAYAVARSVPLAWELMAVDLVALAAVGPRTFSLHDIASVRPLPLAAAGLVLGAIAWRGRHSGRAAVAAGLFVAAITRGCAEVWPNADSTAIALHALIAALMTLGAFFDDWLGRFCGGVCLRRLAGARYRCRGSCPFDRQRTTGDPRPLVSAVRHGRDGGLWFRWRTIRRFVAIAGASVVAWAGHSGLQSYQQLRRIVTGLDQIVLGLLFFLIAAAISLRKAGLWPRSGGTVKVLVSFTVGVSLRNPPSGTDECALRGIFPAVTDRPGSTEFQKLWGLPVSSLACVVSCQNLSRHGPGGYD